MVTKGHQKLREWAAENPERTHSWIAREIRRSQPTVSAWFAGTNSPDPASRTRLEILSKGVVLAADWATAEEIELLEELRGNIGGKSGGKKKSARGKPRGSSGSARRATAA